MRKLTKKQEEALMVLQRYPNSIIMNDGYITGGHGSINPRAAKALKQNGYIETTGQRKDRLSQLGIQYKIK